MYMYMLLCNYTDLDFNCALSYFICVDILVFFNNTYVTYVYKYSHIYTTTVRQVYTDFELLLKLHIVFHNYVTVALCHASSKEPYRVLEIFNTDFCSNKCKRF